MDKHLQDALELARQALAKADPDELLKDFLEFEETSTGPTVAEMFAALNQPKGVTVMSNLAQWRKELDELIQQHVESENSRNRKVNPKYIMWINVYPQSDIKYNQPSIDLHMLSGTKVTYEFNRMQNNIAMRVAELFENLMLNS